MRYYVSVEVSCGISVGVDASDENEAKRAAEAAMVRHLTEECGAFTSFSVERSDLDLDWEGTLLVDAEGIAIGYADQVA